VSSFSSANSDRNDSVTLSIIEPSNPLLVGSDHI
jgi:hypothetical protein